MSTHHPVRELILIRHAKSSWSNPDLSDRDRPLNKRGKRDALFIGQRLAHYQCYPDQVISSPAKRARKTIYKICKKLSYPKKRIVIDELLYTSNIQDLYSLLQSCGDELHRLFLVGHNHVITVFAEELTGIDIYNIPTCGIAGIRFANESWAQVKPGGGELFFFDYPKKHTGRGQSKISNG